MSAGPAPPNPGAPRGNPKAPRASLFARRGPLIIASIAVGATAYIFFAKRPPQPHGTPAVNTSTTGMQNIENAYSNAGATKTHTKAYGGTPMGSKDNENLREGSPAGTGAPKGFQSGPYGDEQRASDRTAVEKKFQQGMHGDERGK